MLHPIIENLSSLRIILASSSPRRKEIIHNAGLSLEIVPSEFEENLEKSLFSGPSEYVKENSKQKALEVAKRLNNNNMKTTNNVPDLVIGADTVVVLGNQILEKPKNKAAAHGMLKSLSGSCHNVYSGVTFVWPDKSQNGFNVKQFYEMSEVEFGDISDDVISAYVETEEPLDKAGSYGIQGIGGTLVKAIHGDYYNIVGFPLFSFCKELKQWYKEYHRPLETA